MLLEKIASRKKTELQKSDKTQLLEDFEKKKPEEDFHVQKAPDFENPKISEPCEICLCPVFWSSVYEPKNFNCAECHPWPKLEQMVARRVMLLDSPRRLVKVDDRLKLLGECEPADVESSGGSDCNFYFLWTVLEISRRNDLPPLMVWTRNPKEINKSIGWLMSWSFR